MKVGLKGLVSVAITVGACLLVQACGGAGLNSVHRAIDLSSAASTAEGRNDYKAALELRRQAVAATRDAYTSNPKLWLSNYISALSDLAATQLLVGDTSGSDATFKEALALTDKDNTYRIYPYRALLEAYAKLKDEARVRALYQEALANGVKSTDLQFTAAAKIVDPVAYDRATVDLYLRTYSSSSATLRRTAEIADRRGWKTEAARLRADATAIDVVDGGEVKSREGAAAYADAARRYAAAGAPQYARHFTEQAQSAAKSAERDAEQAQYEAENPPPDWGSMLAGAAGQLMQAKAASMNRSASIPSSPARPVAASSSSASSSSASSRQSSSQSCAMEVYPQCRARTPNDNSAIARCQVSICEERDRQVAGNSARTTASGSSASGSSGSSASTPASRQQSQPAQASCPEVKPGPAATSFQAGAADVARACSCVKGNFSNMGDQTIGCNWWNGAERATVSWWFRPDRHWQGGTR